MTDKIRVIFFDEGSKVQEEETPVVLHKHSSGVTSDASTKTKCFSQERCSCRGNPGKCKHGCTLRGKKCGFIPGSEGVKFDSGKSRVDLLPFDALMEIGRVFGYGGEKYEDNNWARGMNHSRIMGAALRHLFAYWNGEDNDPESGFSHLACAGCNLLMLLASKMRNSGVDDRFLPTEKSPEEKELQGEKGSEEKSEPGNSEDMKSTKKTKIEESGDFRVFSDGGVMFSRSNVSAIEGEKNDGGN